MSPAYTLWHHEHLTEPVTMMVWLDSRLPFGRVGHRVE